MRGDDVTRGDVLEGDFLTGDSNCCTTDRTDTEGLFSGDAVVPGDSLGERTFGIKNDGAVPLWTGVDSLVGEESTTVVCFAGDPRFDGETRAVVVPVPSFGVVLVSADFVVVRMSW